MDDERDLYRVQWPVLRRHLHHLCLGRYGSVLLDALCACEKPTRCLQAAIDTWRHNILDDLAQRARHTAAWPSWAALMPLFGDSERLYHVIAQQTDAICIAYLAAADPEGQPITIDTHPHFTLKLFPLDTDGQHWTIFFKLSDTAHQTLLTGVRLVDTGGLQWLAGHVDGDGELSADWTHPEPPLQRLHRYALRVEPL